MELSELKLKSEEIFNDILQVEKGSEKHLYLLKEFDKIDSKICKIKKLKGMLASDPCVRNSCKICRYYTRQPRKRDEPDYERRSYCDYSRCVKENGEFTGFIPKVITEKIIDKMFKSREITKTKRDELLSLMRGGLCKK